MTLVNGPFRWCGTFLVLLVAAAVAEVPAAAGSGHPPVASDAGCVTPRCHARRTEAAPGAPGGSAHQPAAAGECTACHDLELAAAAHFVKGAPAGGDVLQSAAAWDLDLCSACHGEVLLAPDAPPGATGFAAGGRNLHALHVQAGRGRRCLPCHDPHAGRQPKLLREQIPARAGAKIPQVFRGEPGGGWCRTGCHAPKSYRR